MKKMISFIFAVVLMFSLGLTVYAEESVDCEISADATAVLSGGQVIVPVRIAENPGFTNFAIALDYDRDALTLVSINTVSEEDAAYLCGTQVSTNMAWEDENGTAYGYIVSAASDVVTEDGILFTATFDVKDGCCDTAEVKPIIKYLRENSDDPAVFEDVTVNAVAGCVNAVICGDVNGDGEVKANDAALTYAIVNNKLEPTAEQLLAVDVNGDGEVKANDAALVYAYVNNKLSVFPAVSQ